MVPMVPMVPVPARHQDVDGPVGGVGNEEAQAVELQLQRGHEILL
jgi:hypothetical protein